MDCLHALFQKIALENLIALACQGQELCVEFHNLVKCAPLFRIQNRNGRHKGIFRKLCGTERLGYIQNVGRRDLVFSDFFDAVRGRVNINVDSPRVSALAYGVDCITVYVERLLDLFQKGRRLVHFLFFSSGCRNGKGSGEKRGGRILFFRGTHAGMPPTKSLLANNTYPIRFSIAHTTTTNHFVITGFTIAGTTHTRNGQALFA